jgi:hypothetical protein
MYGLRILSDEQLTDVYKQAIENKLDQDFINILAKEMNRRDLEGLSFFEGVTLFHPNLSYQL